MSEAPGLISPELWWWDQGPPPRKIGAGPRRGPPAQPLPRAPSAAQRTVEHETVGALSIATVKHNGFESPHLQSHWYASLKRTSRVWGKLPASGCAPSRSQFCYVRSASS